MEVIITQSGAPSEAAIDMLLEKQIGEVEAGAK
jgi:hypothetical protein